ncbi:hypothetical protein NSK_001843 [Nannochloropsis salina CCMP1776]|uniref:Protein yippee-like n=1 Tax=Nannochloropsis salina CCMP1776 TaxID=1027361 RepID=A0A4D9DBC5_9STRA|nr:hypothetical protein NSK_001843 [Nannochloropsis salina CCMP1776]|eukprot:TFJ86755.1 hypothetical protein NSK_001843 [Nannochloropsis salina CCMP1776]
MGRLFKRYLDGPQIWCCSQCWTHLSTNDQIISKQFTGRGGRAFLYDKVINVTTGQHEKRMLITGLHTVADIFCLDCQALLGWKYEEAFEESQKYKEGKYILEKTCITKDPDGE